MARKQPPPPKRPDPTRTRLARRRWENRYVAITQKAIRDSKELLRRGWPVTLGPGVQRITVAEFKVQLDVILQRFRVAMGGEGREQLTFFIETGERFANQEIKRVLGELGADPNLAIIFDLPMSPEVRAALQNNLGELITGVSNDLARSIIGQVQQGILNAESFTQITNRINQATGFGPVRSRMIARTESLRAFNRAAEARYANNGIKKQMWVAAFDERTDPDCEALHGEVFPVEHSHPPMPLHPNCRCTWVPVIDRSTPFSTLLQTGELPEGAFPVWYPIPRGTLFYPTTGDGGGGIAVDPPQPANACQRPETVIPNQALPES